MNIEESNQYINHKNTSSFINNYIYEIPRKKNDVQDNNKQNKKVINVNYSKTFENNIKNPFIIEYKYNDIKEIGVNTFLKSIFCKCDTSKKVFIFEKLKNMICMLLSSDELVYNFMRNRTLNELIYKGNDNCSKFNLL